MTKIELELKRKELEAAKAKAQQELDYASSKLAELSLQEAREEEQQTLPPTIEIGYYNWLSRSRIRAFWLAWKGMRSFPTP